MTSVKEGKEKGMRKLIHDTRVAAGVFYFEQTIVVFEFKQMNNLI